MILNTWKAHVPCSLNALQKYWLKRPGALTKGLAQLGSLTIHILNESSSPISEEEKYILQHQYASSIWVREIVMSINQLPCVWARSITPLASSHTAWRGIRHLNTRPLAEILYDDPRISRSEFSITRLSRFSILYPSLCRYFPQHTQQANYARCSVFHRDKALLSVTECFLPTFWELPQLSFY